jgi:hypothetical protein
MSEPARDALKTALEVAFIVVAFAVYLYCLNRFDVDAAPPVSECP